MCKQIVFSGDERYFSLFARLIRRRLARFTLDHFSEQLNFIVAVFLNFFRLFLIVHRGRIINVAMNRTTTMPRTLATNRPASGSFQMVTNVSVAADKLWNRALFRIAVCVRIRH